MSCLPYRRKTLYFIITIPILLLYILVFIYLWHFSFILSILLLFFYLLMCFFQAYCCVYQDCPYIGGFCPGVAGIMPASLLAKLLYGKNKVKKSKKLFDINVSIAFTGVLGMAFFPLFWIAKLSIIYAIGYFLFHVVYYIVFGLTVCPVCAIRDICPGGKFQNIVLKR